MHNGCYFSSAVAEEAWIPAFAGKALRMHQKRQEEARENGNINGCRRKHVISHIKIETDN